MFQCLIVSPLTAHFHVCWHYSLKQSEAGMHGTKSIKSGNSDLEIIGFGKANTCELKQIQCITAVWDALCTPMTNFTELQPTIGCIWPLVYFTDRLLAKQLAAAPHNKSLSSGMLLEDLWASGRIFFLFFFFYSCCFVFKLYTRIWKQCCVAK